MNQDQLRDLVDEARGIVNRMSGDEEQLRVVGRGPSRRPASIADLVAVLDKTVGQLYRMVGLAIIAAKRTGETETCASIEALAATTAARLSALAVVIDTHGDDDMVVCAACRLEPCEPGRHFCTNCP